MNRVKLFATLTLLLELSVQGHAQDLDARTPLSLELNLDSRATYETLAERTGLNVVFARDYLIKAAVPFRVENKTPAEALDQLARQTATFWTPWDKKTILVAEDTDQNRKDYERQFVQILPVANRPVLEVVNELRAGGFKQIVATGNAIMVRDTAAQIRAAARAANPDAAAPTFDLAGTRSEGDKKVSSPYSFFTSSSGETSSLRIGAEVPVSTTAADGQTRFTLQQIGTQVDSSVTADGDGRFNLKLTLNGKFFSPAGQIRSFTSTNTFTLKDGESTKVTGSDDGGGAYTVDVSLTVVK